MTRLDFAKKLAVLAELTQTELTKELLQIYDTVLRPHGYDRVVQAVQMIITNRSARDRFPSPADIRKNICGEEVDIHLAGVELANLICGCISRIGKYNAQDAWEEIGPIGRHIILRYHGSWFNFCASMKSEQDVSIARSQLAKLAVSAISSHQQGRLGKTLKFQDFSAPKEVAAEVAKLLEKS